MLWNVLFTSHTDDSPTQHRQVYADTKMEAKAAFRYERKGNMDYIISITEVDYDLM